MFEFFAKILCMDALVNPFQDKTISELTSRLGRDRMPFLSMPMNGDKSNKWVRDSSDRSSEDSPTLNNAGHDQQLIILHSISIHLGELVDFLKSYRARTADRDRKDRVAREWKAVGLIFDRIFFIIYLVTIIASLCIFLPIITNPEINLNVTSKCKD